ncbi:hypothetical protein [Pelagicoccus sp. SDUM812002]|uniref:hypothetical protein n=1 Tax=Pelagicoccus sp. SDUM812002 TaxID=3041266 RepID=UPI00280C9684|nr:hypothetical protein [Pelagicoccus sp. SDUM812002]MDQ8186860.1 hypothetical protein [Pelagicoccus sp. SDUM812002]
MAASDNPAFTPLPQNLELVVEYDAIVIRRTWKSALAYFLIVFALFWNIFMVVWTSIAISNGVWIMAAFGSIHATVGIFLIYYTIALFVNKTDIRIDTYNLSVNHYPLPWKGKLQIPVENVQQVYCKEKITRNKNNTSITYEVHCIDRNNKQKKLLSGLTDSSQAQFIEAEVEKILGVKDRPVSGEFKK